MNVKLDKYKSKYIILNDFSTWNKSWITLLEENREIMELYIRRDKEIEKQNRDKGAGYDPLAVNNYYSEIQCLQKKFSEIFYKEEKELLCFHATRLMDYEVEDIKAEGLNCCSEESINNKINNLFKRSIINDYEHNLLQSNNVINDAEQFRVRKHKLYFIFGYQDIRCSTANLSALDPFLLNYGGEAIYRYFDRETGNSPKKELLEKLNSLSKPYIVISKFKTQELEERFGDQLFDTIMMKYIENVPNKISNEFYTLKTNVSCLDVIEVDENSILE